MESRNRQITEKFVFLKQGQLYLFALLTILLISCAVDMDLDINGHQLIGDGIPNDFVEIEEVIPEVILDVRYLSSDNFVGTPIDGYQQNTLLITEAAADALIKVQNDLSQFGFGLKVYDAYRPQQAVDHFVRWAKDLSDIKMKQDYYPNVAKENLFRDGYIAERSGHSRGSTVDLTIVELSSGEELDMGGGWDYFDPLSWPSSNQVSAAQKANRLLLQTLMTKHGFRPLQEEWWHFTLNEEPYADQYFDFPVMPR